MIAAAIEGVGADGVVAGWAHDDEERAPCLVQLRLGGHVLAESVATEFRAGLLAAGRGHGHYGFHARLRHTLPPGRGTIELLLPRHGRAARIDIVLPAIDLGGSRRVEQLLGASRRWTAAELIRHPGCLDLARQRDALGPARLVDRLYRFALDRWPAREEGLAQLQALEAGRVSTERLLCELLRARDGEGCVAPLPGPFDPEYPFLP